MARCSKACWRGCLLSECRCSRVCLDWRAFTYSPWLPLKWQWQWVFLVYRWCVAAYFLSWLIVSGVASGGPKFFIYLTHWSLIAWVTYLLVSACSATFKYVKVNVFDSETSEAMSECEAFTVEPDGCCGTKESRISWYQWCHWIAFYVGAEAAFTVLILYWSLLYRGGPIDGVNANSHLVNGIVAIIDVLISGTPVCCLHFVFLSVYGATYSVFSGIYYAENGTDPIGHHYIYPVLDYGDSLAKAVVAVVCVVLILAPIIHLIFYGLFWLRVGCSRACRHYCYSKSPNSDEQRGLMEGGSGNDIEGQKADYGSEDGASDSMQQTVSISMTDLTESFPSGAANPAVQLA